jgi:dTDP-4-dehydrorhamnose reductase
VGSRKKVLVLGAGGQLGASLLTSLARFYDTVGLTHKDLDISLEGKVADVFSREIPWAVINAAAWTDVDGCEKDVEKSYTVNAIGAENVATQAHSIDARVVHISTDYVFDGFKTSPYNEDDEPNPLSIYGKSKWEGERLVRQVSGDCLIVRSSWLFGSGRSNFVKKLMDFAGAKTEIPVVTDKEGSPTYAPDLADAIASLLAKDARGLFHVSNQGGCTRYEYAEEILKLLKITRCKIVPTTSENFKTLAPRPAYSVMDSSRCCTLLGKSMRPWPEALADFIEGSSAFK